MTRWLSSLSERESLFARSPRQRECYEVLEAAGGASELALLTRRGAFSSSVVRGLQEKGVISVTAEEVVRDPFRESAVTPEPRVTPNTAQQAALAAMAGALGAHQPRPFLLYGVTGSGKTLVYIELLEAVLARGQGAIVLVPEISLTPQTVARFRARFGDRIAVLHSALSDGERYDAWRQLRSGEKLIAVGARSAVFAPIPKLGALVIDEEHDGSYKQSETPRYHARDVAVMRAALTGSLCVLGSATPSLESWWNAARGKSTLLTLPSRATGQPLPPVQILDLRKQRRGGGSAGVSTKPAGHAGTVLAPPLEDAIRSRLHRREQVILLLNRRGFSNFVQCQECGDVRVCVHCSVSMTYHRVANRLLCHHCRHGEPAPTRCLRCGSRDLSFRGLGTEQVERVVAETFPGARIARMDVDTTSGKWAHHEILGRVGRGEVDILLGTQMIAKGLDFPRVTLVGVVNADVGLHLPDFRASERTFQLLSQVAGRAGRSELGGDVMIQTFLPEHYSIQSALSHDYEGFARRELSERRSPAYPPHVRLANVVVSSPNQEHAAGAAEMAVGWVRRSSLLGRGPTRVELVGPAPSPIERLHGRWRWHFFLRSSSPRELGRLCRALAFRFRPGSGDVRVAVDRDPTALL
jgi:primosomal protein N' (replication factor Y)